MLRAVAWHFMHFSLSKFTFFGTVHSVCIETGFLRPSNLGSDSSACHNGQNAHHPGVTIKVSYVLGTVGSRGCR